MKDPFLYACWRLYLRSRFRPAPLCVRRLSAVLLYQLLNVIGLAKLQLPYVGQRMAHIALMSQNLAMDSGLPQSLSADC